MPHTSHDHRSQVRGRLLLLAVALRRSRDGQSSAPRERAGARLPLSPRTKSQLHLDFDDGPSGTCTSVARQGAGRVESRRHHARGVAAVPARLDPRVGVVFKRREGLAGRTLRLRVVPAAVDLGQACAQLGHAALEFGETAAVRPLLACLQQVIGSRKLAAHSRAARGPSRRRLHACEPVAHHRCCAAPSRTRDAGRSLRWTARAAEAAARCHAAAPPAATAGGSPKTQRMPPPEGIFAASGRCAHSSGQSECTHPGAGCAFASRGRRCSGHVGPSRHAVRFCHSRHRRRRRLRRRPRPQGRPLLRHEVPRRGHLARQAARRRSPSLLRAP